MPRHSKSLSKHYALADTEAQLSGLRIDDTVNHSRRKGKKDVEIKDPQALNQSSVNNVQRLQSDGSSSSKTTTVLIVGCFT